MVEMRKIKNYVYHYGILNNSDCDIQTLILHLFILHLVLDSRRELLSSL